MLRRPHRSALPIAPCPLEGAWAAPVRGVEGGSGGLHRDRKTAPCTGWGRREGRSVRGPNPEPACGGA